MRENVGADMVNGTVVDALREPEVPVIVRVYWPSAAVLDAVSVSELKNVAGLSENLAVTPLGSPVTDN